MGQERLSALALMKIHYSTPVDLDIIIDQYKARGSEEFHCEAFLNCKQNNIIVMYTLKMKFLSPLKLHSLIKESHTH